MAADRPVVSGARTDDVGSAVSRRILSGPLARAVPLLRPSAVVILDEATAHMDAASEAEVQAAVAEALSGRTALVIAHRLSTVIRADIIFVLDDGVIVEQGTHAELLAENGRYAQLYRIQLDGGTGP